MTHKLIKTDNYLLVVEKLKVAKLGQTFLTKEGVIHNFVGWNYGDKLVIAHLPLNDSPILEGVPLLPPYYRHQEDGVEELAMEVYGKGVNHDYEEGFVDGYNKAREKYKYTEEDMRKAYEAAFVEAKKCCAIPYFDLYIQSLHQYPTEFECETEPYTVGEMSKMPLGTVNQKPKTITTTQGIQWVGKYK